MKEIRSGECKAKLERINKALSPQEPDRIPVGDFFWQDFIDRWKEEKELPADADINRYYDLDYIVTMPNCDPHIRKFDVLKITESETIVRTGFEAVIRRIKNYQMPVPESFATDSVERLRRFESDDPRDERRFSDRGCAQIAGIEEEFNLEIAPWTEIVDSY